MTHTTLPVPDNSLSFPLPRLPPPSRHRLSINLGFALATLLTTWTGWYSYRESIESRESSQWVAHTYEVLGSLSLVISSLQEAETGQRGYIISGKEEYLGPYYHSATRLAGQLGQLRSLTADHPVQRQRVDVVSGMAARRLALLNRGIEVRRTRGRDAALAMILAGQGKALMDSARSALSDMQAIERSFLRERSATSGILARRNEHTIMLGTGLGLLLLATSALLANWEILARLAAESGLRRANEELEARVDLRTQELQIKIEERALIEVELRAGKDFLRKVVDTNPQLIFIKDWDGRFVLANLPVAELYGTTVGALEGKSDGDFNPNAAEVESFLRADQEVMQSGRRLDVPEESVTDRRSGVTRWFQTVKVPLTSPDGRGRQVLGVSTEITQRRHAEEQLRRTRDELQALVEAAPVAIVSVDPQGRVVNWYGGAKAMFGWSAEEAVGRPLLNVPPDKQEEHRTLRARVLQGKSFTGFDTRRIRKDGTPVEVSLSTAPLHDRGGNVVGIIGVYQDISERRLLAEQRVAREARDTLTHMIVHDLRSPLTGLQGYLDLLRLAVSAGSNDEALGFARDAHGVAGHLKEMISQVLDVSRLESGDMPLSREDTNLVELLSSAVASLGPPPNAIDVVYETAGQPVVIACDRDVMTRVLANLVGNAFKFAPRRGEVRIGLEASRGMVRVTVADNGPGVDPEHRKVIFEKFAQAPLGRAGKGRSTGLGLTFCKLAIEAHGGKIGVGNCDGGGARFWVELPGMEAANPIR
ncbi:MAG: CHASE3 domain-containing protein [Gemmatimonadales bacterium]